MKKVLLINMPFTTITYPSIALSLLKANLCDQGIPCDIKYLNMVFADLVGVSEYEQICKEQNGELFFGERFFSQELFAEKIPTDDNYCNFLDSISKNSGHYMESLQRTGSLISRFLDQCIETIRWDEYALVGFTTMFEQNLASVSLARRIKIKYPDIKVVFGGANCEGDMGLELHRQFKFIDYVCSGEGDVSFPQLVRKILNPELSGDEVPGIIYREKNSSESVLCPGWVPIENMDSLSFPDYDDYFEQLKEFSLPFSTCLEVQMETSRGCWWGEKHHCTFCGLNGMSMGFRAKGKERVIREIFYLRDNYIKKYNVPQISMVDNILDMSYFKEIIPELIKRGFDTTVFYETKPNLNKEQIRMLSQAHVYSIQPGIESLNTKVLKLIDKGVSSLQNIQLLKFCEQFGVYPSWNILYGFPGESSEDYQSMIDLLYKLTHLQPPDQFGPFLLQRFSPYFSNPKQYGIVDIKPKECYKYIYPFKTESLSNLAYYFEFEYEKEVKPPNFETSLTQAVGYWKECYEQKESLYYHKISENSLLIEDERSNSKSPQVILQNERKAVYEYCELVRSFTAILQHIRKEFPEHPIRPRDLRDFLNEMVDLNLIVTEEDKYLSLAISAEEQSEFAYSEAYKSTMGEKK